MADFWSSANEGIAASQALRDNARRNAALNALTQTYGPVGGDPETWMKATQAKAAQDVEPYAAPRAQADIASTQAGTAETQAKTAQDQADLRRMAAFRGLSMLGSAVDPATGGVSADAFDKILTPQASQLFGLQPDDVQALRGIVTAPGGAAHLDDMKNSLLGPAKVAGASTVLQNPDGSYSVAREDQYGRMTTQPLGNATPVMANAAQQRVQQGAQRVAQGQERVGIAQQNANTGAFRADVTANNSTYGGSGNVAAPQTDGQDQPPGIRNNNPLNLQPGGTEASYGSPTAGLVAASQQLDRYAANGTNTISSIITKWAPPKDAHGKTINDTASYIKDVANKLGLDPNKPIDMGDPNTKGALIEAMAGHENGRPLNATPQASAEQVSGLPASIARLPPKGRQMALSQAQSIVNQSSMLHNTNAILDQVQQQVKSYTSGVGSLLKDIPGTTQANLQANLKTLAAQGLTSWIQSLKNSSGQTGIGRVLQSEANAAMAIYGNMEQDQSAKQLYYHTQLFRQAVNKLNATARSAFKAQWQADPESALGMKSPAAPVSKGDAALLAKYGVR